MEPFVLWLNKEELDELTYLFLQNKKEDDNSIMNADDLIKLTQDLIHKNNKFLELFLKLKPIQQKDLLSYQIHNKCNSIKDLILEYHKGCKLRNSKSLNPEDMLNCSCCDVSTTDKFPKIADLNAIYKN